MCCKSESSQLHILSDTFFCQTCLIDVGLNFEYPTGYDHEY